MIDEKQFEDYVRDLGYCNVDIDDVIRTDNGLEIIRDYLEDHLNVGVIPLRTVYEAIPKIIDLQDRHRR